MPRSIADVAASPRWERVLTLVATAVSAGPQVVVVDGFAYATEFADHLGRALATHGRDHVRGPVRPASPAPSAGAPLVVVAGPWPAHPPDVLIWLRTGPVADRPSREHEAQVVVDLRDLAWPVIQHIDEALFDRGSWHLGEVRAFFAARAGTWDTKYGDDLPAYAAAVAETGVPVGGLAIDVGCGTGRALPALRDAVGPAGRVLGLDITEEMLAVARTSGRARHADVLLADANRLPLVPAIVDVVFAAGLVGHVPGVDALLCEFARVTKPGGRLALFHPTGRAALAARHGRTLRPHEPLAEAPLRQALARAGWRLDRYCDDPDRFYALAIHSG